VRCIGKMPERHRVSGNALVSRPSARLGADFARGVDTRARAGTHMWTAPGLQEVVQRADRIAWDHMSGLLMAVH